MNLATAMLKLTSAGIWMLACLALLVTVIWGIRFRKAETRLKENNQGLLKKNETYRKMLQHSSEGVLIVQQFKFKYANSRVYEIMGVSKNDDISRNLVDYIFPDDLPVVLENYEKTVSSNKIETSFKVRLLKPDNSILWVHIRFIPVILEGEPANLAFMRNITTQKMLEQDLHQAQRMEAIGALSGGIAHDFNNILTTIIGNAEIALMDISEHTPGKKEFEQIRKSGYRARDLVRQILTISREHTLDVQPISLTPIIKEALKLLKSTLPKNINIIQKIDTSVSLVKADSIQMYQVFMNLCTNAKHAMEKSESCCLEVELNNIVLGISDKTGCRELKPGNYVKLSVRDNGVGIDPGILHKIFEPYFSTKEKRIGAGLGLATTQGIVKGLGGHIEVNSEPGTGSCFMVYLPVYEEKVLKNPIITENEPVQGQGKILFVDDEKEITVIAKRMLSSRGFSVMTANSGKQALECFCRDPDFFDLMITDLSMPEMTGERLAKEVMQIRPGFPVIMCTGHSDTFDETAARKSGIMEYISKPYNLNELSVIAATYIKKSKAT